MRKKAAGWPVKMGGRKTGEESLKKKPEARGEVSKVKGRKEQMEVWGGAGGGNNLFYRREAGRAASSKLGKRLGLDWEGKGTDTTSQTPHTVLRTEYIHTRLLPTYACPGHLSFHLGRYFTPERGVRIFLRLPPSNSTSTSGSSQQLLPIRKVDTYCVQSSKVLRSPRYGVPHFPFSKDERDRRPRDPETQT